MSLQNLFDLEDEITRDLVLDFLVKEILVVIRG
jgi:hypothetical protein